MGCRRKPISDAANGRPATSGSCVSVYRADTRIVSMSRSRCNDCSIPDPGWHWTKVQGVFGQRDSILTPPCCAGIDREATGEGRRSSLSESDADLASDPHPLSASATCKQNSCFLQVSSATPDSKLELQVVFKSQRQTWNGSSLGALRQLRVSTDTLNETQAGSRLRQLLQ